MHRNVPLIQGNDAITIWRFFIKTKFCLDNFLFFFNSSYLEKFTEFLSLFVSIHLKRFEPNHHFPTAELLDLLVKYTVLQVRFAFFFDFLFYFCFALRIFCSARFLSCCCSALFCFVIWSVLSKICYMYLAVWMLHFFNTMHSLMISFLQ